MFKLFFAILATALSASVFASDELLTGDPARGEALTMTCMACHGSDGNSLTDAMKRQDRVSLV